MYLDEKHSNLLLLFCLHVFYNHHIDFSISFDLKDAMLYLNLIAYQYYNISIEKSQSVLYNYNINGNSKK